MLEVVIATILGINVGFYIGYVCGKEKALHESRWDYGTLIEKPKHVVKDKDDKIQTVYKEDKPFIIEDDDDIFLKINNDKEEIM